MRRIVFFIMLLSIGGIASADNSADVAPEPSLKISRFEDGRDYFSYEEPIALPPRQDKKIPIQFFFDYDCRVCSVAQDILSLYSQINADKVVFSENPVATERANTTANIFFTLRALNAEAVSDLLLFESSEKPRYVELEKFSNLLNWLAEQQVNIDEFKKLYNSVGVRVQVRDAIKMTEDYGVFTYPYVIVGGKYVLTASTLYNDDYSFAVLDFLINKLSQENK
ncbi:thiol:disulfide interchange protein DsbA/DsbL [Caviibacterium pharyngocola]|uniref:Thiol:disulfide interchange protein n=1 Tax=Caviibacterium pharyngocola TaxID=28159 RepID=A0A2M8RW46_9PAST|nr:thiol:disulfide interchange protein DsbA/DsbL [Caviibacterium pharyngocola]PJG83093.1 thiol:disulfide interchange protein [Caviibacterium pharyngocola]